MPDEDKKIDEDLERLNAIWHKLPRWLQIKIFLTVLWYTGIHYIHQIPILWIKYQLGKEGKKDEIRRRKRT